MSNDATGKCAICLKPYLPFGMGEKNGFHFNSCKACGTVFTTPPVTRDMLEQFYAEVEPQIVHQPRHELIIKSLETLINRITGNKAQARSFLDIRCRQGYAVQAAKALGMHAQGIDDREFFIEFASPKYGKGLFETTTVADVATRGATFDVIISLESISECEDPEALVASVAKLMAPNGIAYFEEIDGNSYHLPKSFTYWDYADPPINNTYVSKDAFKLLLDRHGLKIQKSFWTWSAFMKLIVVKK